MQQKNVKVAISGGYYVRDGDHIASPLIRHNEYTVQMPTEAYAIWRKCLWSPTPLEDLEKWYEGEADRLKYEKNPWQMGFAEALNYVASSERWGRHVAIAEGATVEEAIGDVYMFAKPWPNTLYQIEEKCKSRVKYAMDPMPLSRVLPWGALKDQFGNKELPVLTPPEQQIYTLIRGVAFIPAGSEMTWLFDAGYDPETEIDPAETLDPVTDVIPERKIKIGRNEKRDYAAIRAATVSSPNWPGVYQAIDGLYRKKLITLRFLIEPAEYFQPFTGKEAPTNTGYVSSDYLSVLAPYQRARKKP